MPTSTDKRIDILAGLKVKGRFRHSRTGQIHEARNYIEIQAPELKVNLNENQIAEAAAKSLALALREQLLREGIPGATPSDATMERRRYRLEQASRNGAPKPGQFRKPEKEKKVKQNFMRRFRSPRLGYMPPMPSSKFGVESGLLARSIAVVPDIAGWRVYFANPRAIIEKGRSAVQRVFEGGRLDTVVKRLQASPGIQKAMERVRDDVIMNSAKLTEKILNDLNRSLDLIEGIGNNL